MAGMGSKRGQRGGGDKGKRREARYLLPCLSESKKSPKVESGGEVDGNQRKRERGESRGGNKS